MAQDAAFAASLKETKSPEELLARLREAGYDLTMDDLKALKSAGGTAISDEDLDKVAGGWWIFW